MKRNNIKPPADSRPFAKSQWLYVRNGPFSEDQEGETLKPRFPDDSSKPVELLIVGQIGYDWWSNSGVALQEFLSALASIPENREITIGINSEGGNVQDGLGIYNAIRARSAKVTCRIDGYACSIASVLALAGGKTVCPKTSVWMIHDPWSVAQGNADDMRQAAAMLEAHAETLVAAYSDKTGMDRDKVRQMMKAETWMSGEQAASYGSSTLIDYTTSDHESVKDSVISRYPKAAAELAKIFASRSAQAKAEKPAGGVFASATDSTTTKGTNMVPDNKTVPAAEARPTAQDNQDTPQGAAIMAKLQTQSQQIEALNLALAQQHQATVAANVDAAIAARRIPVSDRETWIAKAVKDADVLNLINNIPPHMPADSSRVEFTSPDIRDIAKGMEVSSKVSASWKVGDIGDFQSVIDASMEASRVYNANHEKLTQWVEASWHKSKVRADSTNTIDAALQRTVILNETLRAFKKQITPLAAFSTVYSNVALQGAGTVQVPYYPLSTTASTDFVEGTGYTTTPDTVDDNVQITVNRRKYQSFTYSSATLRRQPYFNVMMHLTLKAEQLGLDVWSDVLSVVTNANFGAASITKPFNAFDYDDLVDLSVIATQADWPYAGRAVFLDAAYDGNLRKDNRLSSAMNSGTTDTLRMGVVGQVATFNTYPSARIPTNSENLVGMIIVPSAIVCATAPIEPAPGVRQLLVRYEMVVDPSTGIAFTYRHGGNATTDVDQEIIECAYGFAKGEGAALRRITSA
jgi:ATP-dependent Clp endopeptidase proteolytic subunit ClpP